MLNINRIQILGNVGNVKVTELADKETGEINNKVAVLSVATNREYTIKQGNTETKKKEVQWHRIVVWGRLVEVVEKWIEVGSAVIITGRMEYRKYKDSNEIERWISEIIAKELILLDKTNTKTKKKIEDDIAEKKETKMKKKKK